MGDCKQDYIFTVRLNPAVTGPAPDEALLREFADWYPGPVLLEPGTKVRHKEQEGEVVAHGKSEHDDPRIVLVRLFASSNGHDIDKRVLISKLVITSDAQRKEEEKSRMLAVESLLTPNANLENVTFIGYSEYMCDNRLQREYWLSLDAKKLTIPLTAGQLTKAGGEQVDRSLCVVHVQYNGKDAVASEVSRASLRPTKSIMLRTYRDKCSSCRQCQERLNCEQCMCCNSKFGRLCFIDSRCSYCNLCRSKSCKSKKLCTSCKDATPSCRKCKTCCDFCMDCGTCETCKKCLNCAQCSDAKDFTSCKDCPVHLVDCDICRNYKWANGYGIQIKGLQARLEHIFKLTPTNMHVHQVKGTYQRRFALLIGNSNYDGQDYLKNPVNDVMAFSEQLKQPSVGFEVEVLRNVKKVELDSAVVKWTQNIPEDAVALLYFNGHGCELRGERYFVPIAYDEYPHDSSDDAVVKNAETNYVNVKLILSRVHRVLRQDGLIISFWNCCRKNDLRDNRDIMRGAPFNPLIRGLKSYENVLNQFSSLDSPSEISICASSPSCLAFDGENFSPFTHALLSWLSNPELAARPILDEKVKQHVSDTVYKLSNGKQLPEWKESLIPGRDQFAFVKQGLTGICESNLGGFQPPFNGPGSGAATMGSNATQSSSFSPSNSEGENEELIPMPEKWKTAAVTGSSLPSPALLPTPFCLLFIGANAKNQEQLKIQEERRTIEEALQLYYGQYAWRGRVEFKDNCVANSASFIQDVITYQPSILQISCHGEMRGLWLEGGLSTCRDIIDALESHNRNTKKEKIRLLIFNACMTGPLAKHLCECVDFVIGHGDVQVSDEKAMIFSKTLFTALGNGCDLLASFTAAKLASKPFILFAECVNPNSFVLPVPCVTEQLAKLQEKLSKAKAETEMIVAELAKLKLQSVPTQDKFPVVAFLKEHGLKRIADRLCDDLQLEEISGLQYVNREVLDNLDWLGQVPKCTLLSLCLEVTADYMSPRNRHGSGTDASQSSTPQTFSVGNISDDSDIDSDCDIPRRVVVAARNQKDEELIEAHLKKLFDELMSTNPFNDAHENWSFCMILWIMFLKDAESFHNPVHEKSMQQRLKDLCEERHIREEEFVFKVHYMVGNEVASHSLLTRVKERIQSNSARPCVASIVVIDCMVEQLLGNEPIQLEKWKELVGSWYNSEELQGKFLIDANKFLSASVDGVTLLLKGFVTNSYVTFMHMPRLAAFLLFGFLEARKLQHSSAAGAAGGCRDFLHGFCTFVSSAGHVFNLFDASMPTQSSVYTVVQGLQCLTNLSAQDWEMFSPVKTVQEFLRHESEENDDFRVCIEILEGLVKSKTMSAIENLIPKEETRLDFRAIRTQLEAGTYFRHAEEFRKAVLLVFDEMDFCYRAHLDICQQVTALKAEFEDMCTKTREELKNRDMMLKNIFHENAAEIHMYLDHVEQLIGKHVDSASGQSRRVDDESIALVLCKHESFDDKYGDGQEAKQKDLTCPLSRSIMRDPVTCSDNLTYERAWIEPWFTKDGTSPMTRELLAFEQTAQGKKLLCNPNVSLLTKINQFKEEKLAALEDLKQNAEGEEEKRIFRNRYGYTSQYSDLKGDEGTQIDSVQEFLAWMINTPITRLACLTGPPASGKTVTMQQVVFAAVKKCRAQMERSELPLLPVFMRAAELSKLLSRSHSNTEDLRAMLKLHMSDSVRPKGVDLILELLDLDRIFLCIDGLDEAAQHQETIEASIEAAVKVAAQARRHVRVLLSTREHHFVHSRACLRLLDFDVVTLQPLDHEHQLNMIHSRIPSKDVQTFRLQLEVMAKKNPDLATSPFLLSLMIEVYKKDHAIPSHRVLLYSKQIEGMISRCIHRGIEEGEAYIPLEINSSTLVSLAIEYLEELAFSCQMYLETRDFKLTAFTVETLQDWKHGSERYDLIRKLLFNSSVLGLLTCVDISAKTYRFSHLTLQEYLAARCSVRLYGHAPEKLLELFSTQQKTTTMKPLHPLHSHWKREVLQFAACILGIDKDICIAPEKTTCVFVDFCRLLLEQEEGVGAHCEIVQDFLSECEHGLTQEISTQVSEMLRHKMREIRTDKLVESLCHPSEELRAIVISEMRQFRALDPFNDGIVAALMKRAEGREGHPWHTQIAAILSMTQIALMEHGRQRSHCRTIILEWMLRALSKIRSDSIGCVQEKVAIVKGLGVLFKQAGSVIGAAEFSAHNEGSIKLSSGDDSLLLNIIKNATNLEPLTDAISDVRIIADGLVDWLFGNPSVISSGVWPMRHVCRICYDLVQSLNVRSSIRLAEALVRRVHALSFVEDDRALLLDSLRCLYTIIPKDEGPFQVLDRVKFGRAQQRVRVLEIAEELKMKFSCECAIQLSLCLVLEPESELDSTGAYSTHSWSDKNVAFHFDTISRTLAVVPDDQQLLTYILKNRPALVPFLLDVLSSIGDASQQRIRARLDVVSRLQESETADSTLDLCSSIVYDIIAQADLEIDDDQPTHSRRTQKPNFMSLPSVVSWYYMRKRVPFSSLPSVVTWNFTCKILPVPKRGELTLLALEEIMSRTAQGNLTEVFNPIKDGAPELICVCALLWESTGLTHEHFVSDIIRQLRLATTEVIDAEHAFRSWQLLQKPWLPDSTSEQNYENLLEDLTLADVIFSVNGQEFPAHWFVLAPRNDFFRDLFDEKDGAISTRQCIQIRGVSAEAFKEMLRFLYTYKLPGQEDCGKGLALGEMTEVADRFKTAGLYEHCYGLFVQGLMVSNVIERLSAARRRKLQPLEETVMEYLQQNSHAFQREAMETLSILTDQPNLLMKVTNVLCSGLVAAEGKFGSEVRDILTGGVWTPPFNSRYQVWAWHVCNVMKLKTLGRFTFTMVLHHVRTRIASDPTSASKDLQPLVAGIVRWKPKDQVQEVERQLLLKEMHIGKRATQMPVWTELVSASRKKQAQANLLQNEIDAFFSSPRKWNGGNLSSIDIKTEALIMNSIFQDSNCGWRLNVNTTARINDFHRSILSAKERNVRIFHLGGHGGKGLSFLWNADEGSNEATEFNDDGIACFLGTVAGTSGPMECAVLNACWTYEAGKRLRKQGMPHVICWLGDTLDTVSLEFTQQFYSALAQHSTQSSRNYKRAFFSATDAIRNSKISQTSELKVRGKGGARLRRPPSTDGFIQFLSKDGDSDPVCLLGSRVVLAVGAEPVAYSVAAVAHSR